MWRVLLVHRFRRLEDWCTFVEERGVPTVSEDLWGQVATCVYLAVAFASLLCTQHWQQVRCQLVASVPLGRPPQWQSFA